MDEDGVHQNKEKAIYRFNRATENANTDAADFLQQLLDINN